MNNDEKNTNTPQEDPILSDTSADEDINAFLDSVSGDDSADAFLEQLYSDSLQDLTSDFDTLLKEFESIDPDDPEVEPAADTDTAALPAQEETPSEPPVQEMEDVQPVDGSAGRDRGELCRGNGTGVCAG